jgi:predicted nuclease of restriction endonuclease-like (RecB) superfamily
MERRENDLLSAIREVVNQSRLRVFRLANSALLESYWQIGKLIIEDEQNGNVRADYGKATLKNLSSQLTIEFGKGFDESNLRNIRRFYLSFPIRDALRHELSWTHYRLLSRLESEDKRIFYINEAIASNWNSRELERQINSLSFERTIAEPKKNDSKTDIQHYIKDPYIFEFLGLNALEENTERNLESAIITHIQKFLLEFGKGFAFVARQQHIITDTSDFFIDLVFYNYILKCFVVIDLKTKALSH